MNGIVITKFDAAVRQLNSAIEMYFDDGDSVSIHTLACAAHRVIHDINRAKGGPELLFDAAKRLQNKDANLMGALSKHANFFKHGDRDSCPDCGIQFFPQVTEVIIYSALLGLCHLKRQISAIMAAYIFYMRHNGSLPSEVWCQFEIYNAVSESLVLLSKRSKGEFLDQFLQAVTEK